MKGDDCPWEVLVVTAHTLRLSLGGPGGHSKHTQSSSDFLALTRVDGTFSHVFGELKRSPTELQELSN